MSHFLRTSYHFDLPPELIAAEALSKRDESRLMVVDRKSRKIRHLHIKDLPKVLNDSYAIVANNTRVFKARLFGERVGTGGKVEFFLLKKMADRTWQGLMKTSGRVTSGFQFKVGDVLAEVVSREETTSGAFITAKFSEDPIEAKIGEVPLPPYIEAKRKLLGLMSSDQGQHELEIYNTVFAKSDGSVAAPTAGRHFTPELIQALAEKGILWNELTLHVGTGTFKPVTTDDIREHLMHGEFVEISQELSDHLNQLKRQGKKILSVGTTTTRALEGAYDRRTQTLLPKKGEVNLFIYPGSQHAWSVADALLTNFHLPESTLLMMVASFLDEESGREWLFDLYQEAIRGKYRFYSYGDAMLIL